jgi:peptidoglycan/LPS O-acetylase OafA/YrhL
MTRAESLYFDLVRVVAAMIVLVGHVTLLMPGALPVGDWGHYAVISFFVLSGYVISFVSSTKERSGTEYVISRAARVYSVALAAIALTLICDFIGRHGTGGAIYDRLAHDWLAVRVLASITFTNELWFESIIAFSNGPYWSLCYEVWYYAIFGAATYLRGKTRVAAVVTLAGIAGPKILLLFPIWLLGMALQRYKVRLSYPVALAVFGVTVIGGLILIHSHIRWDLDGFTLALLGPGLFKALVFSADFLWDYVLALVIAANFLAVRSFDGRMVVPGWLASAIRWAAGSTFSIYLFHRPIMVMLTSLLRLAPGRADAYLLIGLTTGLVVMLSYITERRKAFWRKVVAGLLAGYRNFAGMQSQHQYSTGSQ